MKGAPVGAPKGETIRPVVLRFRLAAMKGAPVGAPKSYQITPCLSRRNAELCERSS